MALRVHLVIKGAVMLFSAYGDFNSFPKKFREGCQRTGVKLNDVPNGRKDAADKAILVDMFLFALDNPPSSSIMLISGDVDFAPALHILGQRGYTIILVIRGGVGVSSALCNAGKFVWDWSSVARGETFVPPSHNLPSVVNDLNGLKEQLVRLLEHFGGCLPLARVPTEYQKIYGRPLCVAEYGAIKLVNLFKKMGGDAMAVESKGNQKFLYLRNWKAGPSAPPLSLEKKDKKGKVTQEENVNVVTGGCSSDEFSYEKRVVIKERDKKSCRCKGNHGSAAKYEGDACVIS